MFCKHLEGRGEGRWAGGSRGGTHVYLWLIRVDGWQRPTRLCKVIIFQLKKTKFKE